MPAERYRGRYVQNRPLRERMRAGSTLIGAFVFLPNPSVIEILAEAGLDFFIVDQEHAPKSWETVENMVRAADVYGLSVVVRVHENTPQTIVQALETGATGVALPFVETAEDVRRAIGAARYAPAGRRGTCTQTRAARHGAFRTEFAGYAAARNEETVLIGLIENRTGVDHIEQIVAVPDGLDAVLLGRADIASDLGRPGMSGDPAVVAVCDRVLAAVRQETARRADGSLFCCITAVYGAKDVSNWRERGSTIFVAPSDSGLFLDAARAWRNDIAVAARLAPD
ncbi:MAG: HpcH/HpaI aldolase/citrate lyase family protein [Lautropia sp.]